LGAFEKLANFVIVWCHPEEEACHWHDHICDVCVLPSQ